MQQTPSTSFKIDWRIINALRGLAALYVVLNHSRGMLFTDAIDYAEVVKPKADWAWWEWINMLLMQHTGLGSEFVIMFFVLSGFSIAHSLSKKPDPAGFYKRRIIRLYPTYFIGIVWAIVVFLVIKYVAPVKFYNPLEGHLAVQEYFENFISLSSLIKNLFYYPVNNFLTVQYWSLPLEVIFYFIAPIVIRKFRWYAGITLLLYGLGWVLVGSSYHELEPYNIPFQFTLDFGIYFLVGLLMYRYKEWLNGRFRMNRLLVFTSLALIFEVVVILKAYVWHQHANKYSGLIMILFSYIILFGFLKNKIRIKSLELIGNYSYTLYVTHLATIHVINSIAFHYGYGFYTIRITYVWYIGIAASLLCAYLLYWVAERPSTKYLERLRK